MDEDNRAIQRNRTKYKDLMAFWIFGFCNNFGYVVMLTAAEDILNAYSTKHESLPNERSCTLISTGIILLADIIPAFIIKILSPFLPYHTTIRVFVACILSVISFIIAATAPTKSIVIFGVVLTSLSSGLGEPTFLYHSTYYNKDTISTWSSGTGASGIIGSLSYSLLRQIGLSSYNTLLIMILVPFIELIAYLRLLSPPRNSVAYSQSSIIDGDENSPLINAQQNVPNTTLSFADKLAVIPYLFIYIVPLILVYYFEYFINQGLFELIVFKNIFLTREQQYHWYQVIYQVGVFVARSSVNIIQIRHTWVMALVQGIIAAFFVTEAVYLFVPSIWIIFVIIFIEGLQGGLAYVNTYYRMSQEVMPEYRTYAMNVVALSDCFGIVFAGFFAIYAHNWICNLPLTTNI